MLKKIEKNSNNLLIYISLVIIYILGLLIRNHYLTVSHSDDTPFWIESAQRFRYIKLLAQGQSIPSIDKDIQWPDGLNPFQDTLIQEYILGTLAYLFQPEKLSLFVRQITQILFCLIVFPMYWLTYSITQNKLVSLFSTALYIILPPSVERSFGSVIYRENIALPVLVIHLASLSSYLKNKERFSLVIVSSISLLLSMLIWKVITFYALFLLLFFLLYKIFYTTEKKDIFAVFTLFVFPVVFSYLIPSSLYHDRYWGSLQGAFSLALFCSVSIFYFYFRAYPTALKKILFRILIFIFSIVIIHYLLPGGKSYDHAWDTLIAKIKFFGIKPDDPSLLSIHARHYWTGNYRSPDIKKLLHDFFIPISFSSILLIQIKKIPRSLKSIENNISSVFMFYGFFAFFFAYIMFYKYATFLMIFFTPIIGLATLVFFNRNFFSSNFSKILLFSVFLLSFFSSWNGIGADYWMPSLSENEQTLEPGHVNTTESLNAFSKWIDKNTKKEDVLLSSWALSPFFSTYLNKRTILHSFFESDIVFRFEDFNLKLFDSLPSLHAYCKKYNATYLVYEPSFLLRTDVWMSYRYVANHLKINGNEAAYILHYNEGNTPGFKLVYQNDYFRLYKVLSNENEISPPISATYSPIYDINIPGAQVGAPRNSGHDLLYGMIKANQFLEIGKAYKKFNELQIAESYYKMSLEKSQYNVDTYKEIYTFLIEQKRYEEANNIKNIASTLFNNKVSIP